MAQREFPVLSPRAGQRRVIYAVVEGENTERDYLEYLVDRFAGDPRTFEIKIVWERNGLKPHDVVNRAIAELDELDDPRREQVWAFFDRDEHSRLEESYGRAESAGVRTAFSNPCFELWLLLHFVSGVSGGQTSKTSRISCARLTKRSATSARALQHLTSGH
ncbi:hypothetical protein Aple_067880 [Acrocarpospora pleiomorpha]|uniref:RloB domain-containing protein n=1 Tax=Acrocarpospora pleiomorpha TaxID=90975 RepID=A0A5M3XV28_9ACTN|nr:RloB family protein [Acrocarpospora pleiomorpha]GES23889.1 hypothetical protein Aple_067880 [Acrocarpospora pleiomorpha]